MAEPHPRPLSAPAERGGAEQLDGGEEQVRREAAREPESPADAARAPRERALHELAAGAEAVIVRLAVEAEERALLRAMGLLEGQVIRVLRWGVWGGPLQVRVGEASFALGRALAHCVFVRTSESE